MTNNVPEVDRKHLILPSQRPDVIDIRGLNHGRARALAALANNAIKTLFGDLSTDPSSGAFLTRSQAQGWINSHRRGSFIWIPAIKLAGVRLHLKLRFDWHFLNSKAYDDLYGEGMAFTVIEGLRQGAPCTPTLYAPINIR